MQGLQSISLTVHCQLGRGMSAQLSSVSLAVVCQAQVPPVHLAVRGWQTLCSYRIISPFKYLLNHDLSAWRAVC